MAGKTPWEETLHDMVVECAQDVMNAYAVPNIYRWMVFKACPEPENKAEVLEKARQKWVTVLNLVEKTSKSCGSKEFIIGDEVKQSGVGIKWYGTSGSRVLNTDWAVESFVGLYCNSVQFIFYIVQ